ncbi:hypothetical protein [Emcibacter nanhaiensis]|uniref:Uncharacterized protein n=1 Tax=Emcibacter nanhaiensis TaxID=1505037 RepID=A0A501PRY0_9PROT|nr:hypothetical protein [Emcibacter nanhaiensis]TPD62995.1 hypothetical protein FIV46_02640 [Emcibacter nanhaiensis]
MYRETLAPGEVKLIDVKGGATFFYPYDCTHGFFEVDYGRGRVPVGRALGIEAKNELGQVEPFHQISIVNTNDEDMTVGFLMGYDRPLDGRSNGGGNTTITGTTAVAGQPLTDDGGSIGKIGAEIVEDQANTVGSAVGATVNLFLPEDNLNGIVLRTCYLGLSTVGTDAARPRVELRGKVGEIYPVLYTLIKAGDTLHIERELYFPPGYGFQITRFDVSAQVAITYDKF